MICSHDPPNSASKSLFINCGGSQEIVDGKTYEDDSGLGGPARFHAYPTGNWTFSTTGVLPGSKTVGESYSPHNISKLTMVDSKLYTRAHVSPISLTYYGYCLQKGSYIVNLHFAKIMIPDDQTYASLGRRVFDIYLQGKLVQKDFNIAKEAGGVGKKIVKQFNNIVVSSNTLEIRLYWAGIGKQNLPINSIYGPLISSISVELSGA
ncbi:probable LRR receptor-like serine/threonine-protein kinase At1g53430 [Vicia villosa]|uniref:probable LRR receptor-like serine/threonine-protein kinase At1g53430 n=1 Tax=Vicia villosa TaxID=3911 RepID=UPI00273CC2B2|nr:probable LRR receptor-like serine/threonine-protein kinase At1g53430 [Vicia villosa]